MILILSRMQEQQSKIQILADSANPIVAGESAVARCGYDNITHCELFARDTNHLPPQINVIVPSNTCHLSPPNQNI